eukprot:tig00000219_g19463.t1
MWALAASETLAPSLLFVAALACAQRRAPSCASRRAARSTSRARGATLFTFELWLALRKWPSIAGRGPAWLLRAGRAGGGGAEAEAQIDFAVDAAERRGDRETRDDRRPDGAAWRLAQAGRPSVSASAPISDTWTHWAGTCDSRANERKLYRSGAAVGSSSEAVRGNAVDVDDIRVWMGVAVPRETLASFADRPLSAEHPYLSPCPPTSRSTTQAMPSSLGAQLPPHPPLLFLALLTAVLGTRRHLCRRRRHHRRLLAGYAG